MKYLLILVLASAGVLGIQLGTQMFGAVTARTTITNQWTFAATTTNSSNVVITTSNTATSSVQVGCIQTTATSTDTPVRLVLGNSVIATTTYQGSTSQGTVVWQYGKCPRI